MISCVLPTWGRFSQLRITLAGFLSQIPESELIIVNQHPVRFDCKEDRVRVLNVKTDTLEQAYVAGFDLAMGKYVSIWDDDDLYLPEHLEYAWRATQAETHFLAWRPAQIWFHEGNKPIVKSTMDVGEPTWTVHVDVVRQNWEFKDNDIHPMFRELMPHLYECSPTYVYRWGNGAWHLSGTAGNGQSNVERIKSWRARNNDHGNGADLTPDWPAYSAAIAGVP